MGGITTPQIIALWSAPRSISTAFFRMMLERGDFTVVHEPFSYLAEFGFVEFGGKRLSDENQVIAHIRALAKERPVFFKDTTDERYPSVLANRRFLGEDAVHTFLIRDPRETIASYYRINPEMREEQVGFGHLRELVENVQRAAGRPQFIMDAQGLLTDPAETVKAFCRHVGIDYIPEALVWQAGERPEWGPSQQWHHEAAASTGFSARSIDTSDIAARDALLAKPRIAAILAANQPHYEALRRLTTAL